MSFFRPPGPLARALALAGLIGWPGPSALAQAGSEALSAADPRAASILAANPPLVSPPVETPALPTDPAEALAQWKAANQRVAAFPRGHLDLLCLEASGAESAPGASGRPEPVSADDALRQSLRLRPDLLAAPGDSALAQSERHQALLAHVVALRRAWLEAVAAGQALRLQQARHEAARTGAELGRRMVVAGNWSQARLLREQLADARESAALLQARQNELGARERLASALGLWRSEAVVQLGERLPTALPAPPQALDGDGADVEARVLTGDTALALQRVVAARDIQARPEAQREAWRQALDESAAGLDAAALPTAPLSLSDTRFSRDHALERAVSAEADLLRAASQRRSNAREAWGRLRAQHALALHTQGVILPLQVALEQETQLRYNGMLQSTWELLEASRERMAAEAAAAQARRDFWMAWLEWQWLLAGGPYQSPGASAASSASVSNPGGH